MGGLPIDELKRPVKDEVDEADEGRVVADPGRE
jgi:hypothetical protein